MPVSELTALHTAARESVWPALAYEAGKQAFLEWERSRQNDSGEDEVWHECLIWAAQHHVSPPFAHGYTGAPCSVEGKYVWQRPDAILTGIFAMLWPAFRNGWCNLADEYGYDPEARWYYVSIDGSWVWR
jgi:hypothetical protein